MGLIKCHSPRQSASCPRQRSARVLRCLPLPATAAAQGGRQGVRACARAGSGQSCAGGLVVGHVHTRCKGGTAGIPLAGGGTRRGVKRARSSVGTLVGPDPIGARPALEHPASSALPADKPRTSPGEAVGFPACKAQLPPCSLMIIIKRPFNSVPHFSLPW